MTATGDVSVGTGTQAGQSASLTVTELGSSFTQSGLTNLTVGAASTSSAVLTVQNAAFTTGSGTTIVKPTGQIVIGGGTYNANGNVVINGGTLERDSVGTFNLAAGRNLTVQNDGLLQFGGSYGIGGGSTFTVQSGAAMTIGRTLGVGIDSSGTLVVNNASVSSVVTTLGDNGFTASATFRNGAMASIGSVVLAALADNDGAVGNLTVESDADLTTGHLFAGSDGNAGTSATITVSGVDSSITQSGASLLFLGSNDTSGAATLTINPGATFSSGTDVVMVHRTGLLDINGGTFNANTDVTIAGGMLRRAAAGAFNWVPARTMNVHSAGEVSLTGEYETPAGATLNVAGVRSRFSLANSEFALKDGALMNVTNGGGLLATAVAVGSQNYLPGFSTRSATFIRA